MKTCRRLKQLREEANKHLDEIKRLEKQSLVAADFRVVSYFAQLFGCLTEIAEISTRRIIRLTWALAILTAALLVVEIRAVFFPKDAAANPQHIKASQNQNVVIPAVTNGQHGQ